ncbi:hypothetical protein AAC387_Pa12g0663 [Persea americana]
MEKGKDVQDFCGGNGDGYDAVVVGSGYGGSVAAYRLSVAGIKVCLIEKGQRWDASDFPTTSVQMMSAVRIEAGNWGISFGSKNALFQIHEQGDSLVGVTCGLGGGSLVNAGVMVSTPVRVFRNQKWPTEWLNDWEACEASASAMLRPQTAPVEFSNARAMREVCDEIEESSASSIKLSMNFEHEGTDSTGSQRLEKCLACGNCMSGCPYNAKNSTDKNYLASAIKAGCTVITDCQVHYAVKEIDKVYDEQLGINIKQRRRWRVYCDNLEYICADFVVLSAGVLGTTQILFQSERRGLRLSDRLGFGFSSNGNNVAYLASSPALLNAYGLKKNQFSKVPFQDRSGPAISSSYTSSLGFTIQSAVLPVAYPYLLFKGILTYGWPTCYCFLHGVIDKLKHMVGLKASQGMILNLMGYDTGDGRITLDSATDKIIFTPPHDPLLPRKVQALQKISKRLGGILFVSRYRSTSVHLLGGCNAASDPSQGVCNPNGQVFNPNSGSHIVHPGLYVCDASLIPCSIGINPCLTITTAAEHVSRHLVQDALKYKSLNWPIQVPASELQVPADRQEIEFINKVIVSKPQLKTHETSDKRPSSYDEVVIKETMRGYIGGMPCTAFLMMKMNSRDLKGYHEGQTSFGDCHPLLRGKVGGYVLFQFVQKDKLYIVDGKVDMCCLDSRTPYTQYMCYHLLLASASGRRYILEGKKVMNPYLLGSYAWSESRTLHVTFKRVHHNDDVEIKHSNNLTEESLNLKGELHVSILELLRSLITMKGNKRGRFIFLLVQSLFRTYILQTPRSSHLNFSSLDMNQRPYPPSTLHETATDDGLIITCKQWKLIGERQAHPVLLINGYATESYCLPTEPKDLVRTLLEEGYETWLLQPRLHPLHASNDFTVEDIGKFDIPAAFAKICELHGPSTKIHVIAHCVGGLSIHIALLGGHVSANNVASLTCTNSSMFFKLTTSSLFKMRLPLIPISMAILGKNKIIPLLETLKDSPRHRLLKSIARLIPRCERCTCNECEVLSGIFGNAFWHDNISPTLHHWLNKQYLPILPMSAFPHIRKICLAGHIVDANGKNIYLIHPERMALPTLYISGGRSLLVTPRTSLLANQYMRLHQPSFLHRRVVVEGFGHSDLLIGEESHERVFPDMISHMKQAEQRSVTMSNEETKYSKEALSWVDADDGDGLFTSWFYSILLLLVILLLWWFLRLM